MGPLHPFRNTPFGLVLSTNVHEHRITEHSSTNVFGRIRNTANIVWQVCLIFLRITSTHVRDIVWQGDVLRGVDKLLVTISLPTVGRQGM